MATKFVMALDAGTTSNRAIIFDSNSKVIGVSQKEFTQHFPEPGWVEHDAEEIWSTMVTVMKEALEQSGLVASDIAGIGITNQRETAVIWDKKTGRPIYNAIVWQSRQTASIAEDLKAKGLVDEVKDKTGLLIDAYFSATKIRWILDHVEGGGVVLFKAGEGPDGEHEHLEIEGHLGAPVIDGASLAVQGNAVGPAAALLPLAGHDGINMLAGFRGIKLLAC